MKNYLVKILVLVLLITAAGVAHSQKSLRINIKVVADTVEIDKYNPKITSAENTVKLKMDYGSYEIKNPKELKKLKGVIIESVDIIYTRFPKDMDLTELNKKRLASLYIHYPEIFETYPLRWTLVAQNGCRSEEEAAGYFHGIVITYRPAATLASMGYEKKYLKDVVAGKEVLLDSTVLKIMDRHKDWKNMLIVSDFTGSMSPYIAQVLVWFSLNEKQKRVKNFVFFNDGDMKPDAEKKVGSTGGIYATKAWNTDSVLNTAVLTIMSGGGGDGPENDVEALLYGMEKYPDCDEVILIADNPAPMRDIELISKLKKPVHVILCGSQWGINPEYLQLARATKGSVHTVEKDITDLMKKNDGEIISIGKAKFRIVKDRFVPVY